MPAPTLTSMAQNAAIRNIASITDIAELPYHAVAPILARIDNPQQLRDVEVACPHIAESTGPLWQALIKRDVSNAESKMLYPKDPKNWWKVYRKMVKQESADKAAAEEALMAAMNGLKDAKSGKETTFVPKVFALGEKKKSGFFDGVRQGGHGSGSGGWGGKAPMLWNAKTGKDALGAMQRATASKVKIFKPGVRGRYVPDAKSQIKAAPKSMIQDNSGQEAILRAAAEAKKYAEPVSTRQQTFAPMASTSKAEQAFRNEEIRAQHERERRLRSLTGSTAKPAMHAAPAPQSRSTTTTTTGASSSQRSSGSTPAKRIASLSPSPPPSSSTPTLSQSSQPPRPVVKRKRPAADPFLSSRKRR